MNAFTNLKDHLDTHTSSVLGYLKKTRRKTVMQLVSMLVLEMQAEHQAEVDKLLKTNRGIIQELESSDRRTTHGKINAHCRRLQRANKTKNNTISDLKKRLRAARLKNPVTVKRSLLGRIFSNPFSRKAA